MQVIIQIEDQKIIDTLDSADIGYWATVPKGEKSETILSDLKAYAIVEEHEAHKDNQGRRWTMGANEIRRGLQVIAEKYPHHLKDIIEESPDAITGDVLVQCAIFGEIVYG